MGSDELQEIANELAEQREEMNLKPQFDAKLGEAEVNIRGVADMMVSRMGDWAREP